MIRTDWFFLLGINVCNFQKVPSTHNILEFIEYMQYRYIFLNNTTVCIPYSM